MSQPLEEPFGHFGLRHGSVTPTSALLGPPRRFRSLPGLARPCPALAGNARPALPFPALPCPALLRPDLSCAPQVLPCPRVITFHGSLCLSHLSSGLHVAYAFASFYSSSNPLVFPAAFTVLCRLSPGPAEIQGNQQRFPALETSRNSHLHSAAFAISHTCLLHSVLLLRASSTSNRFGLFTTVLISRRRFQISQRFQGYSLAALTLRPLRGSHRRYRAQTGITRSSSAVSGARYFTGSFGS